MKGVRENKVSGAPPTDLLVCFPTRSHLALMPKPIPSPNRDPNKRRSGRSPLVRAKGGKQMSGRSPEISEPTSPKVTCAGQIKVRPTKNWQSVMEEIEKIHVTPSKHTKKSKHWADALGFKKDVINFITCLGNISFDFRCFGAFSGHHVDVSSDEEDEDEDEDEENNTVFSKWYMVLQDEKEKIDDIINIGDDEISQIPPPNALLLMRCRSAPAKRGSSWVQDKQNVEKEEIKENRETLAMVMKYDTNFNNVSQETCFSRSTSWKR